MFNLFGGNRSFGNQPEEKDNTMMIAGIIISVVICMCCSSMLSSSSSAGGYFFYSSNKKSGTPCTTGVNGQPCQNGGKPSGTFSGTDKSKCTCKCVNQYTGENCETVPSR